MTIDSRKKWATISSEDKEKIFQSLLNHNTVPTFSAHVAQISQDSSEDTSEVNKETQGEPTEDTKDDKDEASMQANVSSSDKGKIHPAALARMMGTTKPKKPALKKSPSTRSANTVSWSVNSIAKQRTDPPVNRKDAPETDGFMDKLETWGTDDHPPADPLDFIGTTETPQGAGKKDDDPFNLKSLMAEGEGMDFW